jgi:hypothetical protein
MDSREWQVGEKARVLRGNIVAVVTITRITGDLVEGGAVFLVEGKEERIRHVGYAQNFYPLDDDAEILNKIDLEIYLLGLARESVIARREVGR